MPAIKYAKNWHSELLDSQVTPFLVSLQESGKITEDTAKHIFASLQRDEKYLNKKKKNFAEKEKVAKENSRPVDPKQKALLEKLTLIGPEQDSKVLIEKLKAQNYFTQEDKIQNVEELGEEYVKFLRKDRNERKEEEQNDLLQEYKKNKDKKLGLQNALLTFVQDNEKQQGKLQSKMDELAEHLKKMGYKGDLE